jgi:uncharacterized membrane protein
MKKKLIITLTHLLIWLLLSVGYFFLAEPIVAFIYPGMHEVEQWLGALLAGWLVIFIGVVISLVIRLRK